MPAAVVLLATLALGACASAARRPAAAPPAAAAKPPGATVQGQPQGELPPPQSQWRTGGEALGVAEPARRPVALGQEAPAFTPFSQDPAGLRAEVAMICGSARASKTKNALAPLVTDLYLSGVDPAVATEALIQADCGSLAAVVREMVAQGGEDAVAAVVGRALFLSGPAAEGTIENAVSAGLERNLGLVTQSPGMASPGPGSLAFAMAYFPSQAQAAGVATAKTVKTLYSNATPGYGIYTFVLLGARFDPKSQPDVARYAELLRVIETYVLAADKGERGPSPLSHAFLIAVQPRQGEVPLIEQTGPAFSEPMRRDLARYLRQQGQTALAARLEERPGPFLVSSLEPRLMPGSRVSPRLIVDLSAVGSEYMYAVVDAYDQPVAAQSSGRPESLGSIRDRLLGLFNRRVPEQDLDPALKDAWVFRLGGPPPGAESGAQAPGEAGGGSAAAGSPVPQAAPAPVPGTAPGTPGASAQGAPAGAAPAAGSPKPAGPTPPTAPAVQTDSQPKAPPESPAQPLPQDQPKKPPEALAP